MSQLITFLSILFGPRLARAFVVVACGLQCLSPVRVLGQSAPLPPSLLNHNLLPPSPDAAALGRYGNVPVSLYTGVPSIDIPLCTMPGRALSVALSLQYHGGGVRLDQIAPWTGMNWTLNAGGAITRTCRGIDDFSGRGYARNAAPILTNITSDCRNANNSADATDYYEYVKDALSGELDTQPDLFSFNFQGYSGKIIFDQQGRAYTSPSQPIRIQSPLTLGANYWILTTPDGTAYRFATPEVSLLGNLRGGTSAWYLSSITSPQGEQVNFYYGDYTTTMYYLNERTNGAGVSTQQVYEGSMVCNSCPRSLNLGDRPSSVVHGKYLRRISSATHRVDLESSGARQDQPGMRQLDLVRLKYLADSSRYQEYRLQYYYYSNRLFLKQVQKIGVEPGRPDLVEPPYLLTYQPLYNALNVGLGSYAVDRWGYYNAATNTFPFPRFDTQTYQILAAADRNVNASAVTFGALQRIQYPTGGYSAFEFESNDFSNVSGPVYAYSPAGGSVCAVTDELGNPGDGEDCQPNSPREMVFTVGYEQAVNLTYAASPVGTDNSPVTQLETSAAIYSLQNPLAPVQVYGLAYQGNGNLNHHSTSLLPGTYRLVVSVNASRAIRAEVSLNYKDRREVAKKVLGGGIRIKRVINYDGLDHANDQIKEYYYDNDVHNRSTGRLIHQPVFHSRTKEILVVGSNETEEGCLFSRSAEDPPTQYTCKYLLHFAEDIAAASGTAQGAAVGYDTVSVVQRDRGTVVRSSSVFYNLASGTVDMNDQYVENQGFIPINNDERNGQLLETLDYEVKLHGDAFRPLDYRLVRRVTNRYGNDSVPLMEIPGLVVGGSLGQLLQMHQLPCRGIIAQSYRTQVGWWPLVQAEETQFDGVGRARKTLTRVFYDNLNHLQPTRRLTTGPDGLTQIARYKYPLDYAPTADPGIRQLQDLHFVSVPVEEQSWVQKLTGPARWLGGKVTRFTPTATWGPVPSHIYKAAVATPQPAPVAETLGADGRYTSLLSDPTYELRAEMRHERGQLAEQALRHDKPAAYLWGYGGIRPIAETQNASVDQIAYTSFEPDSPGGWRYAGTGRVAGQGRTGNWAYQLNAAAAAVEGGVGTAAPGKYEVTLWVRGGVLVLTNNHLAVPAPEALRTVGGWTLLRWRFTSSAAPSVSITAPTGPVLIDELRLYPAGGHMTSLTYDGLGNITSRTDPTGRTAFFEFDALGRLSRSRDEQGRLLAEYEYRYTVPQ